MSEIQGSEWKFPFILYFFYFDGFLQDRKKIVRDYHSDDSLCDNSSLSPVMILVVIGLKLHFFGMIPPFVKIAHFGNFFLLPSLSGTNLITLLMLSLSIPDDSLSVCLTVDLIDTDSTQYNVILTKQRPEFNVG